MVSICFFDILKCFLINKSWFLKNKFTHKEDNSEYNDVKEFLFPIAIKIKLVAGFIPADEIAFEICNVIAKRIKISVSILFESKILFFSALIERDKIFFKWEALRIKLLDTAWNFILGYFFLKSSINLISIVFWAPISITWICLLLISKINWMLIWLL